MITIEAIEVQGRQVAPLSTPSPSPSLGEDDSDWDGGSSASGEVDSYPYGP
jgi:hypothetical protein